MNLQGPIIVIEDDIDDQQLFAEAFAELAYPNELRFFGDGFAALDYLTSSSTQPFLILSDVNLPKLNGLELRRKLNNDDSLRLKCIPYLFFTTSTSQKRIVDAYSYSVQGFFIKPSSYPHLLHTIRCIMEYWMECKAPLSHLPAA